MFHEEKEIDGIMCFRTHPNSDFRHYTLEQLSQRYIRLKEENHELKHGWTFDYD